MIGRAIHQRFSIKPILRSSASDVQDNNRPCWDPLTGEFWDTNEPVGVVLNLSGAPIAAERWSNQRKKVLWDSRVMATRHLVDWMLQRPQRPNVLISASAVGYYGDGGDDLKKEQDSVGNGFLASLSQAWEQEALRAAEGGIRVVILRMGSVLSLEGGVLKRLLPIYRKGGGGPIAGGQQFFPWIHIDDLVSIILWAANSSDVSGSFNVVAPQLIHQKQFAQALGKALRRPANIPAPAIAIKLTMGEMGKELVLQGQKVAPNRLIEGGFQFQHSTIQQAFNHLLCS